jgi:CRP-like cAMP-binding protein
LGTTPETFSRLLKKLTAEDFISVEGRNITLKEKLLSKTINNQ